MSYDFTSYVDRQGTGSHKWEAMYEANAEVDKGILPLSVADMEIKSAPEIYTGLVSYLQVEPILGYSGATPEYLEAVVDWQKRRHDWEIKKKWIVSTPGVVAAMHTAIKAFSNEGDGVIIFRPVYYPFSHTIENNDRKLVNVPLLEEDGYYTIDFDAFEKVAAQAENKVLLFCSPHNPIGRVWTEAELTRLADIAVRNDLLVISDEIWYDFTQPNQTHTILHKVNEDLQSRLLTLTSASKSFNLAGTYTSNIIISDEGLRNKFAEELTDAHLSSVNILGYEATRIAYTEAEPWLDELNELVHSNQQMVHEFFKNNYPKIKAPVSEGTYVQWLDFGALEMDPEERTTFLHEAQCFTNPGSVFGEEGNDYERFNVALPKDALQKILDQLLEALLNREKE